MPWKRIIRIGLAIFALAFMTMNVCLGATVSEVAKHAKRPEGAPRPSDVSMRLFVKKKDQAELAAAKAFHITRADWSYIKDPGYIKMIHDLGWTFQGTMNATTPNPEHAKRDENDQPTLDHFQKDGRYWADNGNISYRQWYLQQMVEWVKVGADSIQRDEPTTCKRTSIPDAVRFFREIHASFEKQTGRHVPLSCNLMWNGSVFGGKGRHVAILFDFGMTEMGRDKVKPDFFWNVSKGASRFGKSLVYTSNQNLGLKTYRLAIAGCYATGMHFIVPWDQYAGVNEPRVFSRPRDLADLYGFVRANGAFFDGYEDAAAVGYRLADSRWATSPILELEKAERTSAFIRAKPGNRDAAVIIHLIEWGEPRPLRIRLNVPAFFETGEISVSLKSPVPYDAKLHAEAEEKKGYANLSQTTVLPITVQGDWRLVEVPALTPWGMLVVSKKSLHGNTFKDDGS